MKINIHFKNCSIMKQRNIFLIVTLLVFVVAACGERKAAEEEAAMEQEEMAEDIQDSNEDVSRMMTGGKFDCDKAVRLYQEVYDEYQKYLDPALKGDEKARAHLDKLDNTLEELNYEMDKLDVYTMDMECATRISAISLQIQALVAKSVMGAGFGQGN